MRHRTTIGVAAGLVAVLALVAVGATWKVGQSDYAIGDDTGVAGVRKDSRATLADADGEYTIHQFTANGDLRVRDDDLIAALEAGLGANLTYSDVKIDQAGPGRTTLLAGVAGQVNRLHKLVGTIGATGTVKICYDDDGNGTNEVALTGDMDLAALSGLANGDADPRMAIDAPAGKYLTIVTTGGDFNGWAIVSKE